MAGSIALTVSALVVAILAKVFYRAYQVRSRLHNLPGPRPHSWILGHLKVMGRYTREVMPHGAHPHQMPLLIAKEYGLGSFYYLDVWPFTDPLLTVFDPEMIHHITIEKGAAKHPSIAEYLELLAGPGDLISSDGAHWKKWRSIMNPGFAAGHLMTLIPSIVDQSLVFSKKMATRAEKNDVFRLEEDATRLTYDVIGKVALDLDLNTQQGDNIMIEAFREQVHLLPNASLVNPFTHYTPWRIYKRWRNMRIMRNFLGKVLDERFTKNTGSWTNNGVDGKKQKRRTIIDLALDSYASMQASEANEKGEFDGAPVMDTEFREQAITQCLTFMFAGHDTTSSTICYVFYLLNKRPECLKRMRTEHDGVFGSISETEEKLKANPHLLNQLEYTMAVIKETLRIFTPGSSPRKGERGWFLRDPKTGEQYPTEGCLVWVVHYALQRNPAVWGEDADEFKPERWMPENADKLPQGGWRAFESGSRNCIGQELALIETKVILALTARKFDFAPAFNELDALEDDGSYYARDKRLRQGPQSIDGEEAYQVMIATAKPREGMPMRVKVADVDT